MRDENKPELQPAKSRFKELIEATDSLSLGTILDVNIDLKSGDTILTKAMVDGYDDDVFMTCTERWSSFSVSLDGDNPKDRSYLAVAHSKINELNLGHLLYQQVLGETDHSDEIRQLELLMFEHYSPVLYHAALRKKIILLDELPLSDPNLQVARAQLLDELQSFLSDSDESAEMLEQPEEEMIAAVKGWLYKEFGNSLDVVNEIEGTLLNAPQLMAIFNTAIIQTPALRDTGWKSKVVERMKNAVSTRASRKEIIVSSQRVVSKVTAGALVVHEVLGHALRSANAEQAGNEVGSIGTATYQRFEESFEMVLEQCFKGTYDPERGLNHYIAAGLVVTDLQPPDKIAQIFASIKQLEKSEAGITTEIVASSDALASSRLKRTFAGMTDVDIGVAHLQDINYLHGLNSAWKLLSHLVKYNELDEGMKWLLSAKFNPYDETDRELTNIFTPMPSSLYIFFEQEGAKLL